MHILNAFSMPKVLLALDTVSETMPEGSILQLDSQLLVNIGVMALNVIVLVVVLVLVLYKPVKKFLNQRSERIQQQLEDASDEKKESEALKKHYEKLIANIDIEREEILKRGKEAALEHSEEIIAEARKEANNIYRRGLEDLHREQENHLDETKDAIIEIATMMAAQFVAVSMDEETQQKYVEEAMEQLEEVVWRT